MKLYDRVKAILEKYPDTRKSDKKLMWAVWWQKQMIQQPTGLGIMYSRIQFMDFMNATNPESITRVRRKIQEEHPELASSAAVQAAKDKKEESKGAFVSGGGMLPVWNALPVWRYVYLKRSTY